MHRDVADPRTVEERVIVESEASFNTKHKVLKAEKQRGCAKGSQRPTEKSRCSILK